MLSLSRFLTSASTRPLMLTPRKTSTTMPVQGDLFGNSGKDNTQGMLYLSRMDPSRDPKKTRLETSEEMKRKSLAQLGVKDGEDIVAEEEVRRLSDPPAPSLCQRMIVSMWSRRLITILSDGMPITCHRCVEHRQRCLW